MAADLWPTLADPNQVELVLLNLAINARDAMPVGGKLSIGTRNVPAAEAKRWSDLAPGDYVEVTVGDTGTGIPPEILGRVFDPFFTTKPVGKGSGLGLSMVHGVAMQSGGTVTIDSTLGQGTTVRVLLPRAPSHAATAHRTVFEEGELPERRKRHARILVVDDDDDVREFTADCLALFGYTVATAESGRAALDLLANDRDFDLCVVDFAMPTMNGLEFISASRTFLGDAPALLVTGYAEKAGGVDLDPESTLNKPFKMRELQERVAALLEKRRSFDNLIYLPKRTN